MSMSRKRARSTTRVLPKRDVICNLFAIYWPTEFPDEVKRGDDENNAIKAVAERFLSKIDKTGQRTWAASPSWFAKLMREPKRGTDGSVEREPLTIVAKGFGVALSDIAHVDPSECDIIGRDDVIEEITAWWNDGNIRVGIVWGFGGEGKSAVASRFIHTITNGAEDRVKLFRADFYRTTEQECLGKLNDHYGDTSRRPRNETELIESVVALINDERRSGRMLIVLDGFETLMSNTGLFGGVIATPLIKALLHRLCRADQVPRSRAGMVLITSRMPLTELEALGSGFRQHRLLALDPHHAEHLFRQRLTAKKPKAPITEDWLRGFVEGAAGHALTISLSASLLAARGVDTFDLSELAASISKERLKVEDATLSESLQRRARISDPRWLQIQRGFHSAMRRRLSIIFPFFRLRFCELRPKTGHSH